MSNYIKFITINLFIFNVLICQSQNFEWLNSYVSKTTSDEVTGVVAEKNGNSIFLLSSRRIDTTGIDSINIGNKAYIYKQSKDKLATYIVKLDSAGQVIKSARLGQFAGMDLCTDNKGSYFISGNIGNNMGVPEIGGVPYRLDSGSFIFVKLDSNFNFVWVTQTGNAFGILDKSITTSINFSENKLFFNVLCKGTTPIGSKTYSFGVGYSPVFGSINTNNGKIIWSNYLYINTTINTISYVSKIISNNNIIYLTLFNYGTPNFYIGSDTFFSNTSYILRMDSIGSYINRFSFDVNTIIDLKNFQIFGNQLFICASFANSFHFGSKVIKLQTTPQKYNNYECFIACLSTSLQPKWLYTPKIIDKTKTGINRITHLIFNDSFLYLNGTAELQMLFGETILNPSNFTAKLDIYGNVLWAISGGGFGTAFCMAAQLEKGVFIGGFFKDTLQYGKHKVISKGNIFDRDGFLLKISDNAIVRGYVKSGPYCAGDSIRIPYKKIGSYDTSNLFKAQLSDANGNFDNGYTDLGFIKSNNSNVIIGKLPDFQVSSSANYRIRILSTSPIVQSYYKVDTLRLLIYSKDKAYIGKDTLICIGDSVNMKTYGGTHWVWSPNYNLSNTNKPSTKAWPIVSTKYRIIISDSSGCGITDTAYKTINVRKPLTIKSPIVSDTTICTGAKVSLFVRFLNGDSLNYKWVWFSIDSNGGYTELKSDSKKLNDTLSYAMSVTVKDSQNLILFLSDGCSENDAFKKFTLKVSKQKAIATFISKDTSMCPSTSAIIIVNFSKGYASGYNWQWYETSSSGFWIPGIKRNNKSSDTLVYSLPLNTKINKQLRIILKDNCSTFSDTANFTIKIRDTLQIALNAYDTLLCKGTTYTWKANGLGGYGPNYKFKWTNAPNGKVLSTSDSFNITADSTIKVNVLLTDNCMPKSISTSFTITVKPGLKATIFGKDNNMAGDTTLCFGQSIKLYAKGTGGNGSGYVFNWKTNNQSISQLDTLTFNTQKYFTKNGGTQKLILVLGDNCTIPNDSSKINITVLPELMAIATFPDSVCHKNTVIFKAKGNGGKGIYQYKWFDANNVLQGSIDSILINYNNASQSGIVKRIVVISDGCSSPDTAITISVFLKPLSLKLTTSDTCPLVSSVLNANPQGGKGTNYSISWWQGNIFLGTTANGTKTVTPNSTPTIYKAVLNDGCSTTSDTVTINIGLRPSLKLTVNGFCLGESTIAKANGSIGKKYNWQINSNNISSTDSILKIILPAIGNYQIRVSTDNTLHCIGRDTANFSIIEKPNADFSYLRLKDNKTGFAFHFTDQSANANAWLWQFGNGGNSNIQNPDYNFKDTGYTKIKLRVSNQNICFDSIEKTIPIFYTIQFFFPNAFTPDGNNLNDDFGLNPNQYYLVKTFHLEIYNRWGERVFQTDDVKEHWLTSTSLDRTQEGIYMFKAVITDIFDESTELTGAVEVLR